MIHELKLRSRNDIIHQIFNLSREKRFFLKSSIILLKLFFKISKIISTNRETKRLSKIDSKSIKSNTIIPPSTDLSL